MNVNNHFTGQQFPVYKSPLFLRFFWDRFGIIGLEAVRYASVLAANHAPSSKMGKLRNGLAQIQNRINKERGKYGEKIV